MTAVMHHSTETLKANARCCSTIEAVAPSKHYLIRMEEPPSCNQDPRPACSVKRFNKRFAGDNVLLFRSRTITGEERLWRICQVEWLAPIGLRVLFSAFHFQPNANPNSIAKVMNKTPKRFGATRIPKSKARTNFPSCVAFPQSQSIASPMGINQTPYN